MGQVLVRNIRPAVVRKLKLRARRNRRSLQEELKQILDNAANQNPADARARIDKVRNLFAGRAFGDSSKLVRRDRSR